MNKVFICVPTFREFEKVKLFLESLKNVSYPLLEVVIINANALDESSDLIKLHNNSNFELIELQGIKDEYWSASLNRGLRHVKAKMTDGDWVILMNIDIEFSTDVVTELVKCAKTFGDCQVGAMAISNGVAISSGVSVKSWALTLNKHPYAGFELPAIPKDVIPVDFLPGRCFIFPGKFLKIAGLIDEKCLPHYHADFEFSYRLNKSGCKTLLNSEILIYADMSNTGFSVFDKKTLISNRLLSLWSIKNPSNPYYRIMMVLKLYPFYLVPSGILLYMLRTCLEVFLGNRAISMFLNKSERGYSGSMNTHKN